MRGDHESVSVILATSVCQIFQNGIRPTMATLPKLGSRSKSVTLNGEMRSIDNI